jgi:hypothetical protein
MEEQMELLALGEDLLEQFVIPHVSYVTMSRLSRTSSTLRSICARISQQSFVRSTMRTRPCAPACHVPIDALSIYELKYLLNSRKVQTAELEAEAGSEEQLHAALRDSYEHGSGGGSWLTGSARVGERAKNEVALARELIEELSMPALPTLCLIFATEPMVRVAELIAERLPPQCVVFGTVTVHGVIGTNLAGASSQAVVSELDPAVWEVDDPQLISVTLVHAAGTRLYPFFEVSLTVRSSLYSPHCPLPTVG